MLKNGRLVFAFLVLNLLALSCSTIMTSESMRYCKRACENRGGWWGTVSDFDLYCICEDGTKAKVYR